MAWLIYSLSKEWNFEEIEIFISLIIEGTDMAMIK